MFVCCMLGGHRRPKWFAFEFICSDPARAAADASPPSALHHLRCLQCLRLCCFIFALVMIIASMALSTSCSLANEPASALFVIVPLCCKLQLVLHHLDDVSIVMLHHLLVDQM